MEVELPEEELRGDARERVRDEEERFEVAPREVQGDLAPDFVGDAFFEVVCWERGEELWVCVGGDGGERRGRRTFSTATERWCSRALASGLSGSAASAACRSA